MLSIIENSLVAVHLFRDRKLMWYHQRNMSTWGQSEKYIAAWIHSIRDKSINASGRTTFLTLHQPPTLEASTHPTKTVPYKNFTQLDSLPLGLIHNIYMWHASLVHCNKLKPVLVQLTQHCQFICTSTSYKLKYAPFAYFMHYAQI